MTSRCIEESWSFDSDALNRAKEKLGLTKEIKLDKDYMDGWSGTAHWCNEKHIILIDGYLDVKDANKTTWHEMTHALQLERDFNCDNQAYSKAYLDISEELGILDRDGLPLYENFDSYEEWYERYWLNPFEAEALHNERYISWRYPLIKVK